MTASPAQGSVHTVSGWRALMAMHAEPPPRMTLRKYKGLREAERLDYNEDRIDYASRGTIIGTPTIVSLIKEVRLLVIANRRCDAARQGAILSGPPTTGKTTALLALGRYVETQFRLQYPDLVCSPVAYISLPPLATPKSIARSILGFFEIHPPKSATFDELSHAAFSHLETQRTQILIIDEIHNLTISSRAGAEASDFLKYLSDRTQATMVYAGVDVEHAGLFDGIRGRQIAGRFTVVTARPFSLATEDEAMAWRSLLASFEQNLVLIRHRPKHMQKISSLLFRRTAGHIGSLANLLTKATILAILDGHEAIDRELIDQVHVDFAAQRATNLAALREPEDHGRQTG